MTTDQLTAAEQEAAEFRRQRGILGPKGDAAGMAELAAYTPLPRFVDDLVQRVRDAEAVIRNYRNSETESEMRILGHRAADAYVAKYGKDKSQ